MECRDVACNVSTFQTSLKKYILFFLIFSAFNSFFPFLSEAAIERDPQLDSLVNLLNHAPEDTSTVYILDNIAFELLGKNMDKAIEYAHKALLLSEKLDFIKGTGLSYRRLGSIYYMHNNYTKALDAYISAIPVFLKLNDKKQLSDCYFSAGIINYLQANYEKSLEYYLEAMKLQESYNDKEGLHSIYNNIGLIYHSQQNYNMALKYYFKSLEIAEEKANNKGIGTSYNNIGEIYRELKKYDKALEYYYKSLNIKMKENNLEGLALTYSNIGSIYSYKGDYDTAFSYLMKCMDIREKLGDKYGIATAYNTIGNFYIQANKKNAAKEYLTRAYLLGKNLGIPEIIKDAAKGLSQIYSSLYNYQKAYEYQAIFQSMNDSIYRAENIKKLTQAEMQYEFDRQLKEQEFEQQRKQLVQQEKINRQRILNIFLITVVILLSLLSFSIYSNFRSIKKFTNQLNEHRINILQQKEELELKNQLIKQQADRLEIINLELERLSIVASHTDNAIIITDEAGNFIWVNNSFSRMFEYSLEQIVEKNPNICSPSTPDYIKQLIQKCIELKETVSYEYLASTRTGKEIWVNVTLTPILDKNSNIINLVAIDSDITELKNAEEKIRQQRDILQYQQKEITDSIKYALRIQQAILPNLEKCFITDVCDETFIDHFVLFKPKDIVSGDFYYIYKSHNWSVFAVADCTGHGVPGAFMSMLGIAFLNEIIGKSHISQVSQILDELREKIIITLQQKGMSDSASTSSDSWATAVKDGMDIALCAIDNNSNMMQFAGANNPLYIITPDLQGHHNKVSSPGAGNTADSGDLAGQALLKEIRADNMPVAIYENMKPFTNHTLLLHKGDSLYLFSDGLADQFGGPKGKKFKIRQFREFLINNHSKTMSEQKEILNNTIEQWMSFINSVSGQKYEQTDDITVIGIKI
ncbi:MAG: tetratricopeptide repeat protein [Bacteroidia bacterium]|nr:tetratricopeptide repeat protein [Bacteroidia bacterium]